VRWIESESKGQIQITLFPSSTLAAPPDHMDAVKKGLADMCDQMIIFTPGRFPLNEITQLPMIFKYPGSADFSLTHAALIEKYPAIKQEFEKEGIKYLGAHANAPAHVHMTKTPIKTLEDFKGKVMISSGTTGIEMMKRLGGSPENRPPTEMYDALAKGVCDGQLLEWEGVDTWHTAEVVNYSTEVGMYVMGMFTFMNKKTYDSLPPNLQKLFDDQRIYRLWGYKFDLEDIRCKQKLADAYKARGKPEIYVLPPDELARWTNTIMPVRQSWVDKVNGLGAPALPCWKTPSSSRRRMPGTRSHRLLRIDHKGLELSAEVISGLLTSIRILT